MAFSDKKDDTSNSNMMVESWDMDVDVPADVIKLSGRAIVDSAAIHSTDKSLDPVHYWLGMWGKVIILAAVKSQGTKQQVDPDKNMYDLNWEDIARVILERTPAKLQHLFSAMNCLRWFENRLRIYKERYSTPLDFESPIDQLIRHYSVQITNLSEAPDAHWKGFYWENLHMLPASKFRNDIENMDQCTKFVSSSFSTTTIGAIRKTASINSASSSSKVDTRCSESSSSYADSTPPMTQTQTQNLNEDLGLVKLDVGSGVQQVQKIIVRIDCSKPDHYHPVVEHKFPVDLINSEVEIVPVTKRAQPDDTVDNSLLSAESVKKRQRADQAEMTESKLIAVLRKLTEKDSGLEEISQVVTQRAITLSNNGLLEYTLKRTEEKIRAGIITDVETLFNCCRCLVSLFLLTQKNRQISPNALQLITSLRKGVL